VIKIIKIIKILGITAAVNHRILVLMLQYKGTRKNVRVRALSGKLKTSVT